MWIFHFLELLIFLFFQIQLQVLETLLCVCVHAHMAILSGYPCCRTDLLSKFQQYLGCHLQLSYAYACMHLCVCLPVHLIYVNPYYNRDFYMVYKQTSNASLFYKKMNIFAWCQMHVYENTVIGSGSAAYQDTKQYQKRTLYTTPHLQHCKSFYTYLICVHY